MDRSRVLWLCGERYKTDALGQKIPQRVDLKYQGQTYDLSGNNRRVYGSVSGVSASEFFEAGKNGLNPDYRVTMFAPDYHGETEAILDGVRYSIYRTYLGKHEKIDLYLARKAGLPKKAGPNGH